MVGSPYVVGGRMYVARYNPRYDKIGLASWYGEDFYGRYTANGEIFDLNAISAASPTMPLPSYARVTNLDNGRSIIVRVNDRGPYVGNRIVDVSVRAAKLLGFYTQGTTRVKVQYVGPAPLQGSSNRILAATLRENEPAPLPSQVRLAEGPLFPPAPPPAPATTVLASVAEQYPLPDPPPPQPVAITPPSVQPSGTDDTVQVLNGRGLY
jgi:peptidoglycan lytic transglycosylase